MPPKGSKKAPAAAPSTPKADSEDEAPSTPATAVKAKTPRPKPTPKVFKKLSISVSGAAPVDVTYENESVHSKVLPKGAGYGHLIKLVAPQAFELVASYMLDNGLQAIVIKPSAPFQFMKLPENIRKTILELLLTPDTKGNKIHIHTDKNANGSKAKEYAKQFGLKHRLAIGQLNKELAAEVRGILYSFRFRFDSTMTLLSFLSGVGPDVHHALSRITIMNYQKPTAKPTMNLLAECKNLESVSILSGVGVNSRPDKTSKSFYAEAERLLQAIVNRHGGNKDAALDVVSFGKGCFTIKEDGEECEWEDEDVTKFAEQIANKLK
ncbi:hypothetical protein E4T47_07276 [Aureobasidium subglaciale]|nr:hypothetical protein E4T47_07276 [Aureobasidium subglaciale]